MSTIHRSRIGDRPHPGRLVEPSAWSTVSVVAAIASSGIEAVCVQGQGLSVGVLVVDTAHAGDTRAVSSENQSATPQVLEASR